MTRVVIMGGGPASWEAALVAAQHDAEVTVVTQDSLGGACVLYDCVPSKTFIVSAAARSAAKSAGELGINTGEGHADVDLPVVHGRVKGLALAQSADLETRLRRDNVRVVRGYARFTDEHPGLATHRVAVETEDGQDEVLEADVVLIATGATPRVLPGAEPDGERILTWRQIYDLPELPEHLVVIGSGVTGVEFASAYTEMGVKVTMVSSRDRVLPHEDADASAVLEDVFAERGTEVVKHARAERVERVDGGVRVHLQDGRVVEGSHALMTVGSVPNTTDIGLERVGITPGRGGFIPVDRVSRTSVSNVYAAGDCTGVLLLASVAAMQGRTAMWHALGGGVQPLRLKTVAANVFTNPEIATVGIGTGAINSGEVPARSVMLPLATNPRAKMEGLRRGFIKLFCRPATGVVIGGVVVAPSASELILPIAMAVQNQLTVDDLAYTFSVYPSLSGSITEVGRQLMRPADDLN
ncbi:NAD(P)H-quinone dehydrogenase [Actinoalloteichus sp. AHMU CJ021]|uniref:Dihydrolipoamide dehydrogenase n=1 Tax=Actinoalloteichus caeruleus DSM 43889 TaxID=1120930 RepID=A0ABT1JM91_ACTCY|nr:NAD(P)H-quinone dehydrogenase [Actinoalloteichus caeruleus]AUS79354.1 NAD(P)H-quinone dehydrogenase [Actinoalloteichus sp. AHMU CJ021]MCP2333645.1 dihydrolipoamide dehydrogenase [Actinoalloteichus caeruleus DSM 43889]